MRALIVSWSVRGHFNPFLPIARELANRGDEVHWVCIPAPGGLADAQLQLRETRWVRSRLLESPSTNRPIPSGEEIAADVRRADRVLELYRLLTVQQPQEQIDALRSAIREILPDVVLVDTMMPQSHIAAALEGAPYLGVCMGLKLFDLKAWNLEYSLLAEQLRPEREGVFRRYGVPPPRMTLFEVHSPHANVMFTTADFVAGLDVPAGSELVGPVISSPELRGEPELHGQGASSLVYVSFGTILYHQRELVERVVDALLDLELPSVVVIGDMDGTELAARASRGRIDLVRYAPQLRLLERASLFVTHCGANSIMEACDAGTPILGIPLGIDQPIQAQLVQQYGNGLALSPSASVRELREALRSLATDPVPRAAAQRLRQSYSRERGAAAVADMAHRLVG